MRLLGFLYGTGRQLVERVAPRSATRHELLNLLFEHPPATTREVLHPELYDERLDEQRPLELPETESFVALRDELSEAMSAAGQPAAWRSRLGEFGLQCVLVELGLPADEAVELAAGWRNDALSNHGDEKHPTATSVIWNLSGRDAALALEAALRRLLAARSPTLKAVELRLGDQAVEARAALAVPGWPDAVLVQSGSSVALVVGEDLGPLMVELR